jgi:hypothetical protein
LRLRSVCSPQQIRISNQSKQSTIFCSSFAGRRFPEEIGRPLGWSATVSLLPTSLNMWGRSVHPSLSRSPAHHPPDVALQPDTLPARQRLLLRSISQAASRRSAAPRGREVPRSRSRTDFAPA